MILSMTGYGKAESQLNAQTKVVVELKGLNSKSMDLNLKLCPQLRSREVELRSLLAQRLERGKVDVAIYYQSNNNIDTTTYTPINRDAFAYYYRELRSIQQELDIPATTDLIATILRIPEVMKPTDEETVNDNEWNTIYQTIQQAMDAFSAFRQQEGAALAKMFEDKLAGITALLAEIEPYEQGRVAKIREHLLANLDKVANETKQQIDMNRLEQEMIFYLEKLDVTEEKVRLTNHIRYFRETMSASGEGVGKKLGFVAQEMGREINTLGSKSNQSEMQIIVVKMKDLLEQIKEQVLNVL